MQQTTGKSRRPNGVGRADTCSAAERTRIQPNRTAARRASPTATRIFISYARRDEKQAPFVADLYPALKKAGFSAWWDRVDMPSRGLTFLQEIRDEIDKCDRLVLIVGPAAMRSDYVRAEWQYALVAKKIVTPVRVIGTLDLLPAELRNLDCPDATTRKKRRATIAKLLRVLQDPPPQLGSLIGPIPEPPPHFQPRVDDISALASRVLPDTHGPATLKLAERVTVIHGIPGSGKTVLAAAFGRLTETRRAFTDGIIWIGAGDKPSREQVVNLVCESTTGVGVRMRIRRDETTRLREALQGKACLIVLDDLWSLDVIDGFTDALSPRSRVLITTRVADLQSSLGALGLRVGTLDEQTALRHFADWTGTPVDGLPPEARGVARECGYLPFALALCGAMVQDGLRWIDLLRNLKAANLRFLDKRLHKYPYTNFLRAMSVSLDQLSGGRHGAARRYRELAVFPSGRPIPAEAVTTLWQQSAGFDESKARKLLVTLQGKSLLRLVGVISDTVTLHDLQWDYLTTSVADRRRLHRLLIAAYDKLYPGGFSTAPEGDYILDQAGFHLGEAGEHVRLYRLVDPLWFARKFYREGLRRSFQDDVNRVIELAQKRCPRDLHQLIRACLIRSSLAALAVDVPPEAVYVLARCDQSAQAMDAVMLADDPRSQITLCSSAASGLKDCGQKSDAKNVALQAAEFGEVIEDRRAKVLAWAAGLMADLGDADAPLFITRAWNACSTTANTDSAVNAMVQTALAAFKARHPRDARQMMRTAEQLALRSRGKKDSSDTVASEIAAGWIWLGQSRRAMRIVESRIKILRRDRAVRSWSPQIHLLGCTALAFAQAGFSAEAKRLWSRVLKSRDAQRDRDISWYGAMVAARLGRPGDSIRWIRRFVAEAGGSDHTVHAELLALAAVQLVAAHRRDQALRFARRALKLLRAADEVKLVKTIRDAENLRKGPAILATIAETFVEGDNKPEASALALEALAKATTFRWDARRIGETKGAIAQAFVEQGQHGRAKEIAAAIEDEYARKHAYARLAHVFALAGRENDVQDVAECINDDWMRSTAISSALQAVPRRALSHAARRFLPLIPDSGVRGKMICWLALQDPHHHLSHALAVYSMITGAGWRFEVAEFLARALKGKRDYKGAANILHDLWDALPNPQDSQRMQAAGCLARLLVFQGDRTKSSMLINAADIADAEYAAGALSRIALAFVNAGWSTEAKTAAERGIGRAALIGEGRPHGTADAYARLALVMAGLHDRDRAVAFAKRALVTLAHESGWNSAYEDPDTVRRAVGALLGKFMEPQAAFETIISAILPDDTATGYVGDALVGLYEHLLSEHRVRAANHIEDAFVSSYAGHSAWLRVRMAALRHAHRDFDQSRRLLADSLDQAAKEGPNNVLDVVEHGAQIIAGIERGRMLERVYNVLLEVQHWHPGSSWDTDAQSNSRLVHLGRRWSRSMAPSLS